MLKRGGGVQRGFTLIEVMITLAVLGFLVMLGLPSFAIWINNSKIRTAAEGMTNGLQLARAEAVRQNVQVQYDQGVQSSWIVCTVASTAGSNPANRCPSPTPYVGFVQQGTSSEGSSNAVVVVNGVWPRPSPPGETVTFNSIGRVIVNGSGAPAITQLDVCNALDASVRKMRIVVGMGGNVRMCDPQVASGDPRACPTGGLTPPSPPC
jgi:type IV fimbrial biogenesis protein FimT